MLWISDIKLLFYYWYILIKKKIYFSLSPSHLETRCEEDTEKKVELLASVATALAKNDLPVPGGYIQIKKDLSKYLIPKLSIK